MYNFYLAHNKVIYSSEKRYVGSMEFMKWLNNVFLPNNIEYMWIKDVSSKSVIQSVRNAETAFKRLFNNQSKFPRYKKKSGRVVKMYFVRGSASRVIQCERHRIKIPALGWIRIKEKGYVPTNKTIKSGTISKQAGRYYISVLVEEPDVVHDDVYTEGIGVDLGITELAISSNGLRVKNINKTDTVRKLEKKLKREQRRLSRKFETQKTNKTDGCNIAKQTLVVQKLYQRLDNIRKDHINKTVRDLVKPKPSWITIEDLNLVDMQKNRHLSKAIGQQGFFTLREKLTQKCSEYGIELRIANRFFASSKTCHNCGLIKSDLKLSDRVFKCECAYEADRDYNASLNLRDTTDYKVA